MDWAISSSSAPMTGAVAAMAEPPQMEEPTPTNTEMLHGILSQRLMAKAMTSEVVMVEQMMGSDLLPTWAIWERLRPKPSKMTAYCNTFFGGKGDARPERGLVLEDQRRQHTQQNGEHRPAYHGESAAQQPAGDGQRQAQQQARQRLFDKIHFHTLSFPNFFLKRLDYTPRSR